MSDRYSIMGATADRVAAVGGKDIVVARYTEIIFAALEDAQVRLLQSEGATVRPVGKVTTDGTPLPAVVPPTPVAAEPTYGATTVFEITGLKEVQESTDPPLTGRGVVVAVIDTGIRGTHELVGGRVLLSKNFTADPMHDGFNHGTGVASLIVAIAPDCGLLDYKVIGDNGEGTSEAVVLAIEECISLQESGDPLLPSIINLSLGSEDVGDLNDPLRVACRAALSKNIWIVASAGNLGPQERTITAPACEKYVIAVGSCKLVSIDDKYAFRVSDFSSRGPTKGGITKPDIVFVGEDIVVASSASDTATVGKSGTSFSCPMATGAAVLTYQGFPMFKGSTSTDALRDLLGLSGPSKEEVLHELGVWMEQLPSTKSIVDVVLQYVCIKPQGLTAGTKDNQYGYGLPFGDYVASGLSAVAGGIGGIDMGSLISGMVVIMMMGMMMKSMIKVSK